LGDFLVAPLYIAENEVCSEIKVMNTNTTSSILAKVVFRERIASHEVDFPIFLTPGDVWSGTVCQGKCINIDTSCDDCDDYRAQLRLNGGDVCLISFDDSNHPSVKEILKTGYNLAYHSLMTDLSIKKDTKIDFTKGYVEVYPIAQFYEGSAQKVQKSKLVERWYQLEHGNTALKGLSKDGVDSRSLSGVVLFKTVDQVTSTIPMKAFKGAHDKQLTGEAISYNHSATPDILLGKDKHIAMLNLLQKDTIVFDYDNYGIDQYLYVLFPFSYKDGQSRRFRLTIRDMKENKYEMIFSLRLKMDNELACISVEKLINSTKMRNIFNKGMIHITELKNNVEVQLGKGKKPSIIPTILRISNMNHKEVVIDSRYIPVK
jgi:hypothetical protein